MRVFVGGLSFQTSDQQLAQHFAAYNPRSAQVVVDRETGHSRGFGFLDFADDDAARRAIAEKDGKELDGRALQVSQARDRQERPARGRAW
jgi:RNA recognition motif-containing protein